MKLHAGRKVFTGLLLTAMVLLAPGCAADRAYYQAQNGYTSGYYGAYDPGYYRGDVIVVAPRPPVGVYPQPPVARPPAPPHVSQLPARPLPAPAPRPMPMRR
jgi:hypothetical protein